MHSSDPPLFRSNEEIAQLVGAFEAGTLASQEFNHHAHMTVALWYLSRMPFADAVATMRTNIQHFAALHGQNQLYHETITGFWMRLLRHALDCADPSAPFAELTYNIITTLGSMKFFFRHYSKDRGMAAEARQRWLEPDLLPLPFRDPST